MNGLVKKLRFGLTDAFQVSIDSLEVGVIHLLDYYLHVDVSFNVFHNTVTVELYVVVMDLDVLLVQLSWDASKETRDLW